MIKRFALIAVLPIALVIFWLSLFFVRADKIEQVWRDVEKLKQ